jgi:hypothetical protein
MTLIYNRSTHEQSGSGTRSHLTLLQCQHWRASRPCWTGFQPVNAAFTNLSNNLHYFNLLIIVNCRLRFLAVPGMHLRLKRSNENPTQYQEEKMQNLGLCSALWAFEQGGNLSRATLTLIWNLVFCSLIQKAATFSHLLRHARGTGDLFYPVSPRM